MRKIILKVMTLIMAATMAVTSLPFDTVLAAGSKWSGLDTITYDKNGNPSYGTITMGKWKGKSIKWRILDADTKKGTAFLLADQILDKRSYHDTKGDITWEKSSLRKWLNKDFYGKAFTAKEKKAVLQTNVKSDDNVQYSTKGGKNTKDKVYLLSMTEAANINYGFGSGKELANEDEFTWYWTYEVDKAREAKTAANVPDDVSTWWLRTPGVKQNSAVFVYTNGGIMNQGQKAAVKEYQEEEYGIRPVINVKLSRISSSKIKRAPKQKSGYDRIQSMYTDRSALVLKKGQTAAIGVGNKNTVQVSMIPYKEKNKGFTIKSEDSEIAGVKRVNNSLYKITGKNVGKTSVIIKSRTRNKEGKYLTEKVSILVGNNKKPSVSDFEDVRYQKGGKPSYHTVTYGIWNGEPLEWKVLDLNEEKKTALLLADKPVMHIWHMVEDEGAGWFGSAIRSWLNAVDGIPNQNIEDGGTICSFYDQAFTDKEKEAIIPTTLENHRFVSDGKWEEDETTTDRISLLSIEDVTNYNYGFGNKFETELVENGFVKERYAADEARVTADKENWWLRSTINKWDKYAYVNSKGEVDLYGDTFSKFAVRPAMYVDISKIVN